MIASRNTLPLDKYRGGGILGGLGRGLGVSGIQCLGGGSGTPTPPLRENKHINTIFKNFPQGIFNNFQGFVIIDGNMYF